jgi:cell division protein FtsW (lipid II flippase)
MPFFFLFLLLAYLVMVGIGIRAAVKKKWLLAIVMLLGVVLLWLSQGEKHLGTFETNNSRVALYFDPSDEGFVVARISGHDAFGHDVVLGQGVGRPSKIRGFYAEHGDAVWIFIDEPGSATAQPVVLYLGTGSIAQGAKAGALPTDAVELLLKR